MSVIDSPQNQYVKRLRSLATGKGRARHREFLVEGVRALEEALASGAQLKLAAHCPALISGGRGCGGGDRPLAGGGRAEAVVEQLQACGPEFLEMTERAFRALSQVEAPEGVAAAAAIPDTALSDLPGGATLVVAAVDVRDPGNLGALLRTADAAGADAFIAAGSSVDLYEPKVVRATAGSIFHLPVAQDVAPNEMLTWARQEGMGTVAACLEDARPYAEVAYPARTLVMVGNEAHGLNAEVASRADLKAFIPMPGRAESLNVTVAAGILIYEILRQRERDKDCEGEK